MRKYELMTIFPLDEEKSKKALEDVRKVLTDFGAEIEKEEPFGDRDLTYEVKKCTRGRVVHFTLKNNPEKIQENDKKIKNTSNNNKYLFVKLEEK